ncbi:uncharacterized protein LOC111332490 [Stylophora pistillata]|uniref:uncharacterized protein LOC111332490 n=1 Tax=Stylophora pistillata TaxID=50429 RepID=UPI000C04693B|nr:uncharacterized protein LOC111332490 [Stylophora pistillata]
MDDFPEKKEHPKDKVTLVNDYVQDGSEGEKPASRKWTILRTTAIFAVVSLVVCGAILTVFLLTRKESCTERLVEVNLEPGETLLYQVEQVLEVRSGELQKGTLSTIVALQVINKTSEEYWFVFKIISIAAEGENLEKIGYVTRGRSLHHLLSLDLTIFFNRSELNKTSKSTKAHESFELYGNQKYDAKLTRYARAILTQLLPTVERNLYELVDGKKPTPNSEPKPEKSSMFPGIVKMHREANTSENDELLIKNKFNRSDITNMTSDIDLDMSYADSSVLNKSNGVVTKGVVHLTEKLNFGEPVQFKKGSPAKSMDVSFTSKVTLLNDEKSRTSYLEDEELADVVVRDFIKLVAPKSEQKFRVKTSEREALNEPSADLTALYTTPAGEDERETNLTSASHDSRHRSRRGYFQKILTAPQQTTFTLFKKKVIGVDVQVKTTVRIESIKKLYNLKLDKIRVDLTLQLGARVTRRLLRKSIDTTKKETKEINGWNIDVSYSIPILWVVTLDVDFLLTTPASVSVDPGPRSTSRLSLTVTPSASVTATLQGSVAVAIIRAGVYGDGHLIRGSLPVTVSYNANRPSYRDTCLDVSADFRILELEAGVFYQWRSCRWHWWRFKCNWGTRRNLYSFGRWSAFSLRKNMINRCF